MNTNTMTSELETRLRVPSAEERGYAPPGLRPSAQRGEVMAPDRAVRRIPWRASSILTAAAIGVVLLSGTLLLVVVRSDIGVGAPMSLVTSAAAALEVDPSTMVETPDGFVAARPQGDRVELVIAQRREDGGWLVRILGTLMAGPFDDNSSTSSLIVVGCGPEWGLMWSTFAIGIETNNGFTSAMPIGMVGAQGRASMVRDGQPWVVAFDPSSTRPGSTFKLYYGSLEIGGGTFPAVEACGGVYPAAASAASPYPAASLPSGMVPTRTEADIREIATSDLNRMAESAQKMGLEQAPDGLKIQSVVATRWIDVVAQESRAGAPEIGSADASRIVWVVRAEGSFLVMRTPPGGEPWVGKSGYLLIDDETGMILGMGTP